MAAGYTWDLINPATVTVEMALIYTLIFFVGVLVVKASRRPPNFPPGPRGWPIAGYFPELISQTPEGQTLHAYELLKIMNDKLYGPIAGFFGPFSVPIISISGAEAVKEALSNPDLDGRADTPLARGRTQGFGKGYIFHEGEGWHDQRRFLLRHLRQLGYGKSSSESIIQDEIYDLCKKIRSDAMSDPDHIVDFKHLFRLSNINIIWAFIAGKRFHHDDQQLQTLVRSIESMGRDVNLLMSVVIRIPEYALNLMPTALKKRMSCSTEGYRPIANLMQQLVEERLQKGINENPNDLVDVYLEEVIKRQKEDPSTIFSKEQLVGVLIDFFDAGSHTTDNAIGWFLTFMVNHLDVQRKIQAELDDVCGDSLPSLEHRSNLVYTDAALREAQRMRNVAPFAIPHRAVRQTKLQGYTIPKDSIVLANLHAVHMDENYWTDPKTFRPERHIGENGKLRAETEHFLPFGTGKRTCLGDTIARQMYFLFGAAMVKMFEITPIPGQPVPTLEPKYSGFTVQYRHFKAVVTPRQ